MTGLIVEPTEQASWQRLVKEAAERAEQPLDETKESYLVFLLMRYLQRPDLVRTVLALRFLGALRDSGRLREEGMREVGDQCLIYAGLFPDQAERRRVRIGYFVELGRAAYLSLAETTPRATAALFAELAEAFVRLMDVLRATRDSEHGPLLSALQAAHTWNETGSALALRELGAHTDSIPAPADPSRLH